MLLKYLFTALLIYWFYHAILGPMIARDFGNTPKHKRMAPKKNSKQNKYDDNDGDYIPYEEIK
jgi:hypothetical protein